ncbi:MAG: hypothetical protein ACK5O7_06395 [Holosporales bacterium]
MKKLSFYAWLWAALSVCHAAPPAKPGCDQAVESIAKLNIKNLPGELRRKLSDLNTKIQSLRLLKNHNQCQKDWEEFLKTHQNQLKPLDPDLYQPGAQGTKRAF